MLKEIDVSSIDQLMNETVPESIRLGQGQIFRHNNQQINGLDSTYQVLSHMRNIASLNKVNTDYHGQGYYPCILPVVILRNVLENPKWYTPYTPYQAEIAQGRLEMLLNYQTMIVELTGLDFANASLLDEANAASEAMAMAYSIHNNNRKKFFVSHNLFPQSIDVCKTRAKANGIDLVIGDIAEFPWDHAKEFCGAIFQNPDNIGNITNYTELFAKFKENGIISILAQDIMSTVICKPAGEMGADIAVGSA